MRNTYSASFKYVFFWVVVGNLCMAGLVLEKLGRHPVSPQLLSLAEKEKVSFASFTPSFFWSCYLNLPWNVLASVELWSSAEPIIPQCDGSCRTGVLTLLCSI